MESVEITRQIPTDVLADCHVRFAVCATKSAQSDNRECGTKFAIGLAPANCKPISYFARETGSTTLEFQEMR
jgi:hypothetical protein